MEFELIREGICNALKKVLLNDNFLIREGQEQALCHRFAVYLEKEFIGWNVDCEYNRIGINDDPKKDDEGTSKLPDVVIHRRGLKNLENNLVFIEVKIKNKSIEADELKIIKFTSIPSGEREVQYQYGLSLSFLPKIVLHWYSNGEMRNVSTNCI